MLTRDKVGVDFRSPFWWLAISLFFFTTLDHPLVWSRCFQWWRCCWRWVWACMQSFVIQATYPQPTWCVHTFSLITCSETYPPCLMAATVSVRFLLSRALRTEDEGGIVTDWFSLLPIYWWKMKAKFSVLCGVIFRVLFIYVTYFFQELNEVRIS